MSKSTPASVQAPATIQAAGRHRRQRSCPTGKSRNAKASMEMGITQVQLDSQANTRPAGKDPGTATKARSPY